jgi:hypothetical protein
MMNSSRSKKRVPDFSMSVDGRMISASGLEPESALEEAQEFFVRIHPLIAGNPSVKGKSALCPGFLSEERRFVLKSIKDEGGGVACLHYTRARNSKSQSQSQSQRKVN